MTRVIMNLDESGYQVPDFHQVTSKNESQPMERDAEFRVSLFLLQTFTLCRVYFIQTSSNVTP